MSTLFYHEDDYRQVEIVPAENLHLLLMQADNIEDFGEKHSEGSGYTDMMVRAEHEIPLKDRRIKTSELEAILGGLAVPKNEQVSTGIRPGEITCERTIGYGENYHGLFFDYEGEIVNSVWITGTYAFDSGKLLDTLHEIGARWNLLLMDWNSLELIDLRKRESIEKYIYSKGSSDSDLE